MSATEPDLLTETAELARKRGLMGVGVISQGHHTTPYVALCLDRFGKVTDPRTFNTHATAEGALAELRDELNRCNAGAGI